MILMSFCIIKGNTSGVAILAKKRAAWLALLRSEKLGSRVHKRAPSERKELVAKRIEMKERLNWPR